MGWTAFNNGKSLGTPGSEGGVIRQDDEHDWGARITLEEGANIAPWSITCGIYGWMFHTRYFGSAEEGNREFEQMKTGLEEVLRLIAKRDDAAPAKQAGASQAIAAFVERFK